MEITEKHRESKKSSGNNGKAVEIKESTGNHRKAVEIIREHGKS